MDVDVVIELDVQIFFNDDFFLFGQSAAFLGQLEADPNYQYDENGHKNMLSDLFLRVKVNVPDVMNLKVVTKIR